MRIGEIYAILDRISPFELQEEWDNSGLLLGSMDDEFDNIILTLDIDEDIINNADNKTLIITHHPLIFAKLGSLDFSKYPAKYLRAMIKKDISHIAMHTNFDKTHLNGYVAREIIGLKNIQESDFVCKGEIERQSLEDFALLLKEKFGLEKIRYIKAKESVEKVALTTGSGASMLNNIDADCFLTGDIKYHDGMQAQALGISMIDITHFASERFFPAILCEILKHNGIKAIITDSKDPFTIMQEKK